MINTNSPVIQNMMGVPNGGTSNFSTHGDKSQETISKEAAEMANFSNQPQFSGYGLISSPTAYQQQYGTLGYNPGIQSFNPQSNFTYNRGANPQYGGVFNNNYNQVYTDQSYTIPGYNPFNTNVMYSSDLEERQNELYKQMNEELDEYNKNNVYNSYNYYGNLNRNNPFIVEKYRKQHYALEQEAIQRRVDFNKRISSIAYTYLNGEPPSDEYLNNIYDQKTVTIPAKDVESYNLVQSLERCTVEINKIEATEYTNHSNKISAEHDNVINPNMSLIEFFENAGELYALGLQEEVDKDRRDKSKMYDNSDNYRKYLARQLERRDGVVPNTLFPTLSRSSNILDDGTLQIGLPDWLKLKNKQESEQKYAEDRQKFINSIYNSGR